jgi:putative transposase
MKPISYKCHRFPPDVIRHAVWLYFRFTLSLRDVEALPAKRGIEVSYEAIRCWTQKFGVQFSGPSEPGPTPCGRTRPERRDDREMLSDALDPCSIS